MNKKDRAVEFLAAEVEKYEGKHPVDGGYCPVKAAVDAIQAAYDAGWTAGANRPRASSGAGVSF